MGKKKKGKKIKEIPEEIPEKTRALTLADNICEVDGIQKLVLSRMTQKAIGCVAGEDVTIENPWMYVQKEKIQDNLELHEESSEFLPVKKSMFEYPETEILIGFDKSIAEDMQEFYICSNFEAKETIVSLIEIQKADMQVRLRQSLCRPTQNWFSLGSEYEVDENIVQNLRPLIEVEVNSKYPLYTEKKKFKLRLVEDAIDGYVELLPGRFPISNVYRRRIDAGVQVTPPTRHNEAQTNPAYPKHAWTQYKYEYNEPKLSAASVIHLTEFINLQAQTLSDTIHVNEHINLYTDDYKKMAKEVRRCAVEISRDIISFRDVLASKGKMVADISLDFMRSGVLAASYTKSSFNEIFSSASTIDEVNETTFDDHLVLVWCNSNTLIPKLFLYAYREVNKLGFCPFKPNILIGGCSNGQIVIWDLTGRLEKVETVEILTPNEQKHRSILESLMTWMKNTQSKNVVLPTAVSCLDFSHKSAVTQISWMLPKCQVTKNGKIQEVEEGESMQFMTTGLDGRMLIWDLMKRPQPVASHVKKSQLDKRPSALTVNISEFRPLNNVMIPQYKLNVKDPETALSYPITALSLNYLRWNYKALNPETLQDPFQRTYFEFVSLDNKSEFKPELLVADKLGNTFHCKFEGHDFDQGQKVNFETVKYKKFSLLHDGPIRVCRVNNLEENIVLTVGGRVFAIWDVERPHRPIFWRKSKIRYVGGIWSAVSPFDVVIVRADSYFETWELLCRTKSPGRLVRLSGSAVMDLFSDMTLKHVTKSTFITTDVIGAVRVYKIPGIYKPLTNLLKVTTAQIRERIFKRRKQLEEWVIAWKKIHLDTPGAEEEQKEQENEASKVEGKVENKSEEKKPEKTNEARASVRPSTQGSQVDKDESVKKAMHLQKPESGDTWFEKQIKLMYEITLDKKKLNLAEIEKNKIPLQKLILERNHKSLKAQEKLANKEVIFDSASKLIFKEKVVKKRIKFGVTFPDEITEFMKETFVTKYKDAVEGTLKYIKRNQFIEDFNWPEMIKQGKERRNNNQQTTLEMRRLRFDTSQNKDMRIPLFPEN